MVRPCSAGGGRAQIFLEPEGRHSPEVYVQGFSTGLPERLQLALLHTLPGAPPPPCRPPLCSAWHPPSPGCWEPQGPLIMVTEQRVGRSAGTDVHAQCMYDGSSAQHHFGIVAFQP